MLKLLVSRFNLPHPTWASRSKDEYKEWLAIRLSLFQSYTLASYRNCYKKPDYWLILVDDSTFDVSSMLLSVVENDSRIVCLPCLGRTADNIVRDFLKDNFSATGDGCFQVMTTRLDTDDLISSSFFARLDAVKDISSLGLSVISFSGGCVYYKGDFYYQSYPENPFLTLYENLKSLELYTGVYSKMHTELSSHIGRAIYLRSSFPMWGAVVHENNEANDSLIELCDLKIDNALLLRKKFGMKLEN